MAVVSAAMYKAARGIPASITTQDTNIDAAIAGAVSLIESETGRKLETATHTEYFDGTGQTVIQLASPPVTSFTSLAVAVDSSTWETVESTAYRVILDRGQVVYLGGNAFRPYTYGTGVRTVANAKRYGLPSGTKNIRAIYVGGYAANSLAQGLLEPFYSVVDWVIEGRTRIRSALSDGNSGTLRVNRAAADERESLSMLMRPFRGVIY